MSGYTNYYIVQATSETEVQVVLEDARIKSLIDADKDDYWFTERYKRNGNYNWIVVAAPANSGFKDGMFFYETQFDKISQYFKIVAHFFQEEHMGVWRIEIAANGIQCKIVNEPGSETKVTENDKLFLSQCFGKNFSDLAPFLKSGSSADFLNFIGIPYMEMTDQDKLPMELFLNRYSLLESDIEI